MEKVITDFIDSIEFGDVRTFEKMSVIPLLTPANNVPHFLTLKRALEAGHLVITEVSSSGSVPELLAKNSADIPILLLDGEELAGAKQNRVLNATILLREKSETVIPVSCTEHGRWHYQGDHFNDSDIVMARKLRENKVRGVSNCLRNEKTYRSNQGQVWDDIAAMSRESGVHSETGAMRDVYESRKAGLDEYIEAFPLLDNQKGIFVLIGGKVVGFDIVALSQAYADLHAKLINSYAMDALTDHGKATLADNEKKARKFFDTILSSREEKYKSVGYGTDYRFENGASVGSSLVNFEKVIHMAFFKTSEAERSGKMSGSSQRRANRITL
ncbi:MAG: ARPP-1 family domain-containing protein [Syntrophorhabdaceae bacterium]